MGLQDGLTLAERRVDISCRWSTSSQNEQHERKPTHQACHDALHLSLP